MELKTGARLKSTVCDAEIMVISIPDGEIDLTCGGSPMIDNKAETDKGDLNPEFAEGIQIGKRYVNGDGKLEVLCVKPGDGSLALNGVVLQPKETKKLPKTD